MLNTPDNHKIHAVKARHLDLEVNNLYADDQLEIFDRHLKKLEAEMGRLITLFGRSEIITVEELEEKVGEINAAIAEVAAERRKASEAKEGLAEKRKRLDAAVEHFRSIASRLEEFTEEEKRKLVSLLFSRITIDWDEEKQEYRLEVEVQIPVFRDDDRDDRDSASFVISELQEGCGGDDATDSGSGTHPNRRQSNRGCTDVTWGGNGGGGDPPPVA